MMAMTTALTPTARANSCNQIAQDCKTALKKADEVIKIQDDIIKTRDQQVDSLQQSLNSMSKSYEYYKDKSEAWYRQPEFIGPLGLFLGAILAGALKQ
jgi:uncharacterized protein HemX